MFAYTACRTTKARNARGEGISVYEIAKDGSLGDVVDVIHLEGVPGKNGEPPKGVSHAHQCEWAPGRGRPNRASDRHDDRTDRHVRCWV